MLDVTTIFADFPTQWDCPPVEARMVNHAERVLGYKLPQSYLELLKIRNGGYLINVEVLPASNTDEFVALSLPVLMGIGGGYSIDSNVEGLSLSEYLIREWDFPDIGVVFSYFGHAGFMLDYSESGKDADPTVIFIDAEQHPKNRVVKVSRNFTTFLSQLSQSGT